MGRQVARPYDVIDVLRNENKRGFFSFLVFVVVVFVPVRSFTIRQHYYRVRGDDVLEHVVDGTLGSVALPIVSPSTRPAMRTGRRSVGQTTAQRFVAIGVRALFVIRIEVRVGQVQHFELRYGLLQSQLVDRRTVNARLPASENRIHEYSARGSKRLRDDCPTGFTSKLSPSVPYGFVSFAFYRLTAL